MNSTKGSGQKRHHSPKQARLRKRTGKRLCKSGTRNRSCIKFYNSGEDYYEFTNFYLCKVHIDGYDWPSTEHYFQAQKFLGTPYYKEIRMLGTPREAFQMSRRPDVLRWRRADWDTVKKNIMYKALLSKFIQHNKLRKKLIETGERELIEDSPYDSYWGIGTDGNGQNHLGKLLMRVRKCCRVQFETSTTAADSSNVTGDHRPSESSSDINQKLPLPDASATTGQAEVTAAVSDANVSVTDNLSTLDDSEKSAADEAATSCSDLTRQTLNSVRKKPDQ